MAGGGYRSKKTSIARRKAEEDKESLARSRERRNAHLHEMAKKPQDPVAPKPRRKKAESLGDDVYNGLTGAAYEDKIPTHALEPAQVIDVVLTAFLGDREAAAAIEVLHKKVIEAQHACSTEKIDLRRIVAALERQNFRANDPKDQLAFYSMFAFLD